MDIRKSAQIFGRTQQTLNKVGFDVAFNSIERGLLKQMNNKINDVNKDSVTRDVDRLEKKRNGLVEKSNKLRDLQIDMETNSFRFLKIRDIGNTALGYADLNADNEIDGALDADQVSAINAQVDILAKEISNLKFTYKTPEFTDGNLANKMRQQLADLQQYSLVAGAVDAEGAASTNDNRAFLTKLDQLVSQASTYTESSTLLVGSLNQLIIDTDSRAYDVEADVASLTAGELVRRENDIEDLEIRYGNLIRSISLLFEVNSSLADMLVTGTDYKPDKGSILNILL